MTRAKTSLFKSKRTKLVIATVPLLLVLAVWFGPQLSTNTVSPCAAMVMHTSSPAIKKVFNPLLKMFSAESRDKMLNRSGVDWSRNHYGPNLPPQVGCLIHFYRS